jgi:hypothetical protein
MKTSLICKLFSKLSGRDSRLMGKMLEVRRCASESRRATQIFKFNESGHCNEYPSF